MDTDVQEYQAALNTLKQAAAPFAALTKLHDVAAPLLAVINHEAELRAKVEELKSEVAEWQSKASAARSLEETATADAKAEHEKFVAEYAAHREQLRAEALTVEAESKTRIDAAKQSVIDAEATAKHAIDEIIADAESKRAGVMAETSAFVAADKAQRDLIQFKTTELQAHLDELKGKVSAALA